MRQYASIDAVNAASRPHPNNHQKKRPEKGTENGRPESAIRIHSQSVPAIGALGSRDRERGAAIAESHEKDTKRVIRIQIFSIAPVFQEYFEMPTHFEIVYRM